MLQPDDYLHAAKVLADANAPAEPRILRFLAFLGLPENASGSEAALLRFAGRLDRVFAIRLPDAPGATLFGATHALRADLSYAGATDGTVPGSYAGVGLTPLAAFARCIGEAAEYAAMYALTDDTRTVDARLLRRLDNPGLARSSTGYAAGSSLKMATDAAIRERVERHAIALWYAGGGAALLHAPHAAQWLEAAYRAGTQTRAGAQYLMLPHKVAGLSVVASITRGETGIAVGYGCAPDTTQAACKALTEVLQGEFALGLERGRTEQGIQPPPTGFLARSALFAARSDLFEATLPAVVATGAPPRARITDLTVPGTDIPVVHARIDGLTDIAALIAPGCVGPV
ncbi:MAG: YcaO-like family protein [Gemmobacter sp.]|nr:YcaO-like family protein [Gemmobacter sp.]